MVRFLSDGYDRNMLSYLHGFHAGNAADVLKHSVLIFCLSYLKKKEKPLLCVDTHAGAGFYDLSGTAGGSVGAQSNEWEQGIGRLQRTAEKLPPIISEYVNFSEERRYSGSPVIMARMLEKGDRLVCFELHPREYEVLKISMAEVRGEGAEKHSVEVRREDGPEGLKSLLPPPSRRGLIFIDPSWEEQSEYRNIAQAVQSGLTRFPEGTFIIWYPLLALPKGKSAVPSQLRDVLFGLSGGKRCRAELYKQVAENSPRLMYGSGLVIYNPPWTLRAALEEALPCLEKILGDSGGGWHLDWEL